MRGLSRGSHAIAIRLEIARRPGDRPYRGSLLLRVDHSEHLACGWVAVPGRVNHAITGRIGVTRGRKPLLHPSSVELAIWRRSKLSNDVERGAYRQMATQAQG